jgi:hypothetical protein
VRCWSARVLLAALAAIVLGELLVIAPRIDVVVLIAGNAWMALPGVALARQVFGAREPTGIAAWLIGPALGFGFSVFGLLLLWAAGVQNWVAIVLAPALTCLIAVLAHRFGGPSLRLPAFDRRDVIAVSIALLLVPLVTWAPYDHVREPVAEGEANRAYFTADFVWGMTVTAELAKGEVPPVNPFSIGAPLRYYWMAHLLSGALYRNVAAWGITAEQVLLVDGLAFGLAFVAFFYGLARTAGASPVFAALAVMTAFLANSYEGVNRLWIFHQQHTPYHAVKTLNIDAVTRWFYQGMPVDGLQRMLLYQPHHFTGYAMGLAALWLAGFAEDVTETSVALWAGILLGLAVLFSTFTAIIIGVAVAALFVMRLVARRSWTAIWQAALLGGLPALLGVAISVALGYADPDEGSLVVFGLNPVALRRWPLMLVLSFGPLLLAGLAGLGRVGWTARDGTAAAALVASALAFYFLANVPDTQGVWVGWRSGHLLLIGFAVSSAAGAAAIWRVRATRLPLVLLIVLALAPAIPTAVIDIYNAQDISNRAQGPGFPWTLIITRPEREALDWIRRATPPHAVVQFEPHARGAGWWCYVTAFAERRMAAGLPGAMIPAQPYRRASETVRSGIFRAASAGDAHAIATRMGIDYLFSGDTERRFYGPALTAIENAPELFVPVFRNGVVTVFQVQR